MSKLPRGIRNNNPVNIRKGANFKGEIKSTDSDFAKFDKPENGIRAFFVLLNTYNRKYGLDTIPKVIRRFAPPNENETMKYIEFVLNYVNANKNDTINGLTIDGRIMLFKAFLIVECGLEYENYYSNSLIEKAILNV